MKKNTNNKMLESHRITYRLRSTFYYRKLNEYHTYEFSSILKQLAPLYDNYDWTSYRNWGISEEAFQLIEKSKMNPIEIFSHPRLLREHPILTAYYRNVSVLPQKAVGYLVHIKPNKFEENNDAPMGESDAFQLARLFNEHVSLIIENMIGNVTQEHVTGLLFASTGAQIDGSWRNAIGVESEKIVQKMLIKQAINLSELTAFILKDNNSRVEQLKEDNLEQLERVSEFKGFMLKNKKSVIFSSEPDISLLDKDGSSIAAIEIKGGNDPAGALERYGAAKKSFENSINENEDVTTVLVASCLTEEVEKRLQSENEIQTYFNLTDLLTNKEYKEKFLEYIFRDLLEI